MIKEKMKWCVWKYIDTGKKKRDKVPYNPITTLPISVSRADDFFDYSVVLPFVKNYDELGIHVSKGIVSIDAMIV